MEERPYPEMNLSGRMGSRRTPCDDGERKRVLYPSSHGVRRLPETHSLSLLLTWAVGAITFTAKLGKGELVFHGLTGMHPLMEQR